MFAALPRWRLSITQRTTNFTGENYNNKESLVGIPMKQDIRGHRGATCTTLVLSLIAPDSFFKGNPLNGSLSAPHRAGCGTPKRPILTFSVYLPKHLIYRSLSTFNPDPFAGSIPYMYSSPVNTQFRPHLWITFSVCLWRRFPLFRLSITMLALFSCVSVSTPREGPSLRL